MTLSPLHQLVFRPYFLPSPPLIHIARTSHAALHLTWLCLFILPSSQVLHSPATKEDASNQNHLSTKAQVSSYPPPSHPPPLSPLSPPSPSLSILCRYFFLTTSFYFQSCKGKEVDARVEENGQRKSKRVK